MTATIINAAPMAILRGTQDFSTAQVARTPEAIPQHLAKFYLYTKKGPTTPMLVVGDSRASIYDADSFDELKQWANHATIFSNGINGEGNAQMIERLQPVDANPPANLLLSLDVLPTTVPVYQRNADGTYAVDQAGAKIRVGNSNVPGYLVSWVLTNYNDEVGLGNFGQSVTSPGFLTDAGTQVQSQRYPVAQIAASSFGAWGNNSGVRIWAPTDLTSGGFNKSAIDQAAAYPFRLAVINRADTNSSPKIVATQFSEQFINFTFKKNVIDPVTLKPLYIGQSFLDSYQNVSDPAYPPVIGDFGTLAVYDANIKTLVEMFTAAEKLHPYTSNDFTGAAGEDYLFNLVGGTSSNGAPYNTFQFSTVHGVGGGNDIVSLTELSNLYAAGGSDGTMNDTLHAGLVVEKMADYLLDTSPLQDLAVNVESIMYDSGYPLAAKLALCNFIGKRKDTFVTLATHDVNQSDLTASEEHSLAVALRARAQLFPESDAFGTPVMRAMIVGRSGKLRNSQYTKRLPCSYEVAIKAARYMGAGDGQWKNGKNFDGAPGSVLEFMSDINVTFTSSTVRNKDWDVGLVWVQNFDRRSTFFPALKTVYNDDTSVLNSFSVAMAIAQINKVADQVWREFSGVDHLTNAQLAEQVNASFNRRLYNRFDGKFVIVPEAYFTDADLQRGFSWTVPIKIYAANMKTVMTTSVQAYRIGDLIPG